MSPPGFLFGYDTFLRIYEEWAMSAPLFKMNDYVLEVCCYSFSYSLFHKYW